MCIIKSFSDIRCKFIVMFDRRADEITLSNKSPWHFMLVVEEDMPS
jgi:hypothetical protein